MKEKRQEMVMSFPSDFKYLGAVDAAIQDLAREFTISENSINDMSTALIEAAPMPVSRIIAKIRTNTRRLSMRMIR